MKMRRCFNTSQYVEIHTRATGHAGIPADSLVRKGETEKSTPFFSHNTTEKTAIFAPEIFIDSVFTFINSFERSLQIETID